MARRIAVGVAWWLAVAYGIQMAAMMYGFPTGIAPLAALPLAVCAAAAAPQRSRRPADLRRIYKPQQDATDLGTEPALITGR